MQGVIDSKVIQNNICVNTCFYNICTHGTIGIFEDPKTQRESK